MAKKGPSLESLRKGIDRVDAKLHALLIARAGYSEAIALAKAANPVPGGLPVRAGREAQVMRALAARHTGSMPLGSVLRIWREIIGASASMQAPLKIAVAAADDPVEAFDVARGLYGTAAPLSLVESPRQVLRALSTGSAQLGVLPEPGPEDAAAWWVSLIDGPPGLRIIARLPYLRSADATVESQRFVVVAHAPAEASGADNSYIGLSCRTQFSGAALAAKLKKVGLIGHRAAVTAHEGGDAYHLAEVEGFVGDDDPRLAQLQIEMGTDLRVALALGAYPLDITPPPPTL
jgi:chorismate mutase